MNDFRYFFTLKQDNGVKMEFGMTPTGTLSKRPEGGAVEELSHTDRALMCALSLMYQKVTPEPIKTSPKVKFA